MIWHPDPCAPLGEVRRSKRAAVLAIYHTRTAHWRDFIKLNAARIMSAWGIE